MYHRTKKQTDWEFYESLLLPNYGVGGRGVEDLLL